MQKLVISSCESLHALKRRHFLHCIAKGKQRSLINHSLHSSGLAAVSTQQRRSREGDHYPLLLFIGRWCSKFIERGAISFTNKSKANCIPLCISLSASKTSKPGEQFLKKENVVVPIGRTLRSEFKGIISLNSYSCPCLTQGEPRHFIE